MQASVRLEHNLIAVEGEHSVHAMFELHAPPGPTEAHRAPLRLAVVIDRSGSMAGDKLATTKSCVDFLIRRLRSTDSVALVDYDDEVRLLAPLGPVEHDALAKVVAGIFAGGTTNLSGGWLKGAEELRRSNDDGVRKLLLLTDGLANVGITDTGSLISLAQGAAGEGIGTSTIGFGDGFHEELLTAMAGAGGGNAHYAENPDDAPALFASELEGLVSLVAQNVSLEIRPCAEVEVIEILHDHPLVAVEGGLQVQLGDAYGSEERRVVFALRVTNIGRLGPAKIAEVVLRYVAVGDEIAAHEVTVPVVANVVNADEVANAVPDAEVTEQIVILRAARARTEAIRLADRGDYEAARRLLADAATELRAQAPSSSAPEELLVQASELDESVQALAPNVEPYDATQRKRLHYQAHRAQNSRRQGPKGS